MKIRINWSKLIYKGIKWFYLSLAILLGLAALIGIEYLVWHDFKWEGMAWLNGGVFGTILFVSGICYLMIKEDECNKYTPIIRIERDNRPSWRERRRIRREAREKVLREYKQQEMEHARNQIKIESEIIE